MIHVEPPRYPQTIMNKADRIAGQIDALQALREEKARILKQLHKAGAEIGHTTNDIFKPLPQAESASQDPIQAAQQGKDSHQGDQHFIKRHQDSFLLSRIATTAASTGASIQ